ncbi:MAG: xanthine dehydrogenase family protein molybdopterin-binding subunit, partial [Nocardioidaceae bacterium]
MTVTEDRPTTEVGSARRRKEDRRLITGRTRWTDNLTLPGMLHLAMVRSPMAHATITSIDVDAAKLSPGVVAVFTGADINDEQGSLPCAWPVTEDQLAPPHPSIAVDTVNFAGEIVACIVARSATAAKDAVELVDVEY